MKNPFNKITQILLMVLPFFALQANQDGKISFLYINNVKVDDIIPLHNDAVSALTKNLLISDGQEAVAYYHILKLIDNENGSIYLNDGSIWKIAPPFFSKIKGWKPLDRLKISYHPEYFFGMKFENIDTPSIAWCAMKTMPALSDYNTIMEIHKDSSLKGNTIALRSGHNFKGPDALLKPFASWAVGDGIFAFQSEEGYDLCNITKKTWVKGCSLIALNAQQSYQHDIMFLEDKLNARILAQPEATNAVANALINYTAGLKDPNTPIAVFLFLGPSGVGKTELAKTLVDEYYKDANRLLRFDMSHFSSPHSNERLIGSPPGYVNHEEGGQLTEPLKSKPDSVVLLDEIEKAHPQVQKVFLPIFDEGYVTDSKDQKILCHKAIFILTSNLCAYEISNLLDLGYSQDEVLSRIEPILMERLSPELYNRVQPILFHPLNPEIMENLVELFIKNLATRLHETKGITLVLDQTAKDYLTEHGFHPLLGARPLKKLIENKVVNTVAYALISKSIPSGTTITLNFNDYDNSWYIDF